MAGWQVGERLIAVTGFGGLAEMIVVPAQGRLSPACGPQFRGRRGAAADLRRTQSTASMTAGRLEAGQTLLVLGAAGSVRTGGGRAWQGLGRARRRRRVERGEG